MNKQNISKIALTVIFSGVLAGCSYINAKLEQNPTTQRQQQCGTLKNQMTFASGTAGINSQTSKNPAQEAHTNRLYDQYKCKDLEPANKQ